MNYEIKGGNLPVVCCQLAKGESVQCEAGAMAWMDPGIEMSTHGNGLGKMDRSAPSASHRPPRSSSRRVLSLQA